MDCGRSCDPSGSRCDDCQDVHDDVNSCPTCGCRNTGGDTCDGCDEINREESESNREEEELDGEDLEAFHAAMEKDD